MRSEVLALRRALSDERGRAQREARTAQLAGQSAVRRVLQQLIEHTRRQRDAACQQQQTDSAAVVSGDENSGGGGAQFGRTAGRLRPLSASHVACSPHTGGRAQARVRPVSATAAPLSSTHAKRRPASARVRSGADTAAVHHPCQLFGGRTCAAHAFSAAHARLSKPRPSSAKGCFGTTASVVRNDVTVEALHDGALLLTHTEMDAMIRVRSASHDVLHKCLCS